VIHVDHPQLLDTAAGIKRQFGAQIERQAAVRNFD